MSKTCAAIEDRRKLQRCRAITVRFGWGVGEHLLGPDDVRILHFNKWLIRSMMGGERLIAGQNPLIALMLPVTNCPCLTWFTSPIIRIGYPFPLPKRVVW